VNVKNKSTYPQSHCERSEAISWDCHACVPCLRRSACPPQGFWGRGFAQAGVTPLRCAGTSLPAYRQAGAPRNDNFLLAFTIALINYQLNALLIFHC